MKKVLFFLILVGSIVAKAYPADRPPKDFSDSCVFGEYIVLEKIDGYLPENSEGTAIRSCMDEWNKPKTKDDFKAATDHDTRLSVGCKAGIDWVLRDRMRGISDGLLNKWVGLCVQVTGTAQDNGTVQYKP